MVWLQLRLRLKYCWSARAYCPNVMTCLTEQFYLETNVKDDISDIAAMYNRSVELEHGRLERHQLEFDLTWRYLTRYLPATASILEIGAATGRYTLPLCRCGYAVTAVDLSGTLLAECRRRVTEQGLDKQARFVVADVRDLPVEMDMEFDAVLLMGPLYHLVVEADRICALRQAIARLKSGGLLFSAHISRLGIVGDLMKKLPEWIERREEVESILESGYNPDNPRVGNFRGYFARVAEIAPLYEKLDMQTLVLAGVEPAISADDDSYNCLQGSQRELWLDLLFDISADETIIGASRHLLYIGRKRHQPDQ